MPKTPKNTPFLMTPSVTPPNETFVNQLSAGKKFEVKVSSTEREASVTTL